MGQDGYAVSPMSRNLAAVLLALTLLGAPSAALAQNAGDEQYADPFGQVKDEDKGGQQPSSGTEAPAPSPAPAAPAQPVTQPAAPPEDQAAAPAQTTTTTTTSSAQLPRTGLPVAALALAGAALAGAGAGLRRRL
jgi:hypothetical protein